MVPKIEFNDIANNDRSGLFYEFISPELSKAVAKLQPSGMARDEYHVSIMKEFIAAVKSRKASQELSDAARGAIFKEHMLERLPISPSEFQTMDELEVRYSKRAKLAWPLLYERLVNIMWKLLASFRL